MCEQLKTLELDTEKGVFRINGKDFSISNTTSIKIFCEAGYVNVELVQQYGRRWNERK